MNRRHLLTAAPAFGFAGLLAAGAVPAIADTETPVMLLFREWTQARAAEDAVYAASPTGGDEQTLAATAHVHEIERRLMEMPCRSPQDFVAKVAVNTGYGEYELLDGKDRPDFWAEARQMLAA